jgi:DNA-binding GntR family transcriptional regulator
MAKRVPNGARVPELVARLRDAIFENRLQPGEPIREMTIAREMGVSQATVRDALQRLEHTGLVTRKTNVGTTVTRLSPRDVRERVILRASLEVMAAQQAALRMTESDFEELERRLNLLGEAIQRDGYHEAAQADLEFHRHVWRCSGNDMLCRLLDLVTVPLFAFVSIMRSQGLQKLTSVVAEHSPLIEALRAKDPARIRTAFEKGATSFYDPFLGETGERSAAAAFGFLESSPESR